MEEFIKELCVFLMPYLVIAGIFFFAGTEYMSNKAAKIMPLKGNNL